MASVVHRLRHGSVIIAGALLVLLATTAAAPGPGASRAELMAYSYGSALALITGITIAIKLWKQLAMAAALLAGITLIYLLGKSIVEALAGS